MHTAATPHSAQSNEHRSECYPLYGIVPIVNTPFDERLRIDVPSLERMLEQNIADGISGCIVPAVASEVDKLSMEERKTFIETVKRICGGRIQVVAGASSEVLEETLEIARHAMRVRCNGVLCRVPNRLMRADPRTIFEYFSHGINGTIAEGLELHVALVEVFDEINQVTD